VLLLPHSHNEPMTLSDCPVCGRRELRGARSVHAVSTPGGDLLATTCRGCGSELSAGSNLVLRPAALNAVA
jgi:hypothetical protein